jgi:hypothetical protein
MEPAIGPSPEPDETHGLLPFFLTIHSSVLIFRAVSFLQVYPPEPCIKTAKFTLEQAIKAQRWSRGIALLFL